MFRFLFPSFEKPPERPRYLNLEPETHEFRGVGVVLLLAAGCGVALALWEPSQQVTTPFVAASASRSVPAATGKPAIPETTAAADAEDDQVAPTVKLSTACSQRATARRDCASVKAMKDARLNGEPDPAVPAAKETKPAAVQAKPAAVEAKPAAAQTKPAVAETKPAVVEAKPPVAGAKPAAAQTKPAVAETKPAALEAKPPVTEAKSAAAQTKPAVPETKPAVVEAKPPVAEAKPASVQANPAVADAKPAVAETKPAVTEAKPAAAAAKASTPNEGSVAPAVGQRVSAVTPPETPAVTQPEVPATQPQKAAAAPKAKRQRPVPEEVVRAVREAPVERLVKVYEQVMPDGRRVPVYRRQGSGGYETGTIVDGEYRPARRANLDPPYPRYFGLQ